jgi:uncharacterized protein YhbP (UPF0306 family)
MGDAEIAKHLIESNEYMTLATADASGKPWVSTVFFTYDKHFNLYWVSAKDAQHSRNVKVRPQVGIVIFGPVPMADGLDGVYFDAEVAELEAEDELEEAITVLHTRPQVSKFTVHTRADVSSPAAWRIYRAAPQEISKRTISIDTVTGQAITVRTLIQL